MQTTEQPEGDGRELIERIGEHFEERDQRLKEGGDHQPRQDHDEHRVAVQALPESDGHGHGGEATDKGHPLNARPRG